jgi:hypothetical protein
VLDDPTPAGLDPGCVDGISCELKRYYCMLPRNSASCLMTAGLDPGCVCIRCELKPALLRAFSQLSVVLDTDFLMSADLEASVLILRYSVTILGFQPENSQTRTTTLVYRCDSTSLVHHRSPKISPLRGAEVALAPTPRKVSKYDMIDA